jgi:enoyl-CoA hydratase
MPDLVRIERDGDVALLVLNRPEARNAMNAALASQTVESIAACQDAAVIVITGADPAFCAGLDLRDLGVDELRNLPRFIDAAAASEVPTIAAVNGAAVTGGFELALACDFMIASERARFADTHLRVGVYPGPVAVDLPRRVGMAYAREMSLTGDFVDAAEALRIGLVNHVVPHDELVPFALRKARSIAEQPRDMVAMLRKDWTATDRLPLPEARRVHQEHAARGGFGHARGADIASRREAVITRAHDQA